MKELKKLLENWHGKRKEPRICKQAVFLSRAHANNDKIKKKILLWIHGSWSLILLLIKIHCQNKSASHKLGQNIH